MRALVIILTLLAAGPASAISTAITQIGGSDMYALGPGDIIDIEITLSLDGEGFLYSWSSALVIDWQSFDVIGAAPGTSNEGLAGALHYQFNAGPDPTFCGGAANSCFGGVGQLGSGVVDEGGGVYRLGVYGGVVSVAGFVDQSPQVIARLTLLAVSPGMGAITMSFAGQSALQDNGSNDPAQGILLDSDAQVDFGSLGFYVGPEPSTAVMLGVGLALLAARRRR